MSQGIVDGCVLSVSCGEQSRSVDPGRERTPVIILIRGLNATTLTTEGELLAEHHIDPDKHYQAKK